MFSPKNILVKFVEKNYKKSSLLMIQAKKYVYVVKLKKMKRKRKKNLTRIFNTYIRIAKNYL